MQIMGVNNLTPGSNMDPSTSGWVHLTRLIMAVVTHGVSESIPTSNYLLKVAPLLSWTCSRPSRNKSNTTDATHISNIDTLTVCKDTQGYLSPLSTAKSN